ncbi:MAG: lasso peptide biosynthesis B2 protein [Nitrospirae bacterium]|nr:lasso peptide biosynthesis B2 protein [Nitrospirota bacterium]MBU6479726.1 lasso peptide biosynthesis B2 protein [Nitrospirota bacterium]MDE3221763.1 lasso peptide biosynthesis B2 protein [Nitrospirota bacterium]
MLSTLRRLANLTLVEQTLLLQLIALSLGLGVVLTTEALPRLTSLLSRNASFPRLSQDHLFHARCTMARLVTLIDLATALSHRDGRCLPRSLLLFPLLSARRESVKLCLGISKNTATLEGHAWGERGGIVLGDRRSFTTRYALILRLST